MKVCIMPHLKILAGRSCHSVSFFNQNLHLTLRLCHLGSFFRHNFYPIREGEKGAGAVQVASQLFSHFAHLDACVGFLIQGEKAHGKARGMTFLPFYSTRVLPVPLSRRDNVLVLCKKLSKFYEPPLKSFEFFHQVYINLPLSRNINKRKYRKPSKTVKQ